MSETFIKQMEELINRHSKENESNTPDYILAQYLSDCLTSFKIALNERDRWYGVNYNKEYNLKAPKAFK